MSSNGTKSSTARLIGVLEKAGSNDKPPVRALAAAAAAIVAIIKTSAKSTPEGTKK